MLSLDLARKLKAKGLKHKPEDGDVYWVSEVEEMMVIAGAFEPEDEDVWVPRLDQLLAEVERQGYRWKLVFDGDSYYFRFTGVWVPRLECCKYNAPEDAVADGLLCVIGVWRS